LAIGIDPIAEAISVFEKISVLSRHQWTMASTASIAILLIHTLIQDVFQTSSFANSTWYVLIEPKGLAICEPILKTYCDLIQVELLTPDIDPKEKKLLLRVDMERNAFGVFKPNDLYSKGGIAQKPKSPSKSTSAPF
jgi:hypothetical protein